MGLTLGFRIERRESSDIKSRKKSKKFKKVVKIA